MQDGCGFTRPVLTRLDLVSHDYYEWLPSAGQCCGAPSFWFNGIWEGKTFAVIAVNVRAMITHLAQFEEMLSKNLKKKKRKQSFSSAIVGQYLF